MNDEKLSSGEGELRAVRLNASIATRLNAAFHQNSVPVIAEVELVNDTGVDLNDVTITISAVPAFLQPKMFRLDHVRAGGVQRLNPVPVDLDAGFLLGLTEAVNGEIITVARSGEGEFARRVDPCQLLSPSEWTGLAAAPELIAAFVRPNDPSVDAVLRNAAEKLRQAGRDPSLDGYRSQKKARAWEVTEAIWAALCDERIVYALPPQSFERNGQKVRSPSAVLERKLGTCLDLTLAFAACLEQAGLNPLVGLSEGHAFCGVWLTNDEFPLGVVDESQTLRKRMGLDELILVETTLLTNQPPLPFRTAVDVAAGHVAENPERRFELVIDIHRARHRQIRPLILGVDAVSPAVVVSATLGAAAMLEAPPTFVEEAAVAEAADETLDRLERWKRKLLDLSLRNKLLNFKAGKGVVPLVCPDPAALEDMLAEGKTLKLLPAANVMSGADPRNAELHLGRGGDDAARRYAVEALQRGDLHAPVGADDLEGRLTELYRSARSSFEEGGANSLYLAIGFVSWTPQSKEQVCKAPLLLVPVALDRRTVRSGFHLVRHDDDPRINPTLLQMLRQDFKLVIPEFERELPVDAAGLDVARIWRIARTHLKDVKGFELAEDVVLSTFSFVKYLMWKDLVERTEMLKRNPVVRHLIDTPKESYGGPADLPDEERLDDEIHPRELFMPLPADSSQTAAVAAAARGRDFVLFGPPGTGKSQTIANMIVQLIASGRTVLFVAEKTTALDVVRRRLDGLGLGSFCLEVHSAKAQKTSVLNQLKTAWEARAANAAAEWESTTSELKVLRDRLNAVVGALHRRHRNGFVTHHALGRVIAGRDILPAFVLPFDSPDRHDERDMARLRQTCRDLKTALDAVGDPGRHPLAGICRASWSPIWQNQLVAAAAKFRTAANDLLEATAAAAALLGVPGHGDPRRCAGLVTLLAQGVKEDARNALPALNPGITRMREAFAAWRALKARYAEIAAALGCRYRDGVFELDLVALLGEWRDAANAMIFVRAGRKRRARDALAAFADGPVPEDIAGDIARLMDLKALREAARQYDQVLLPLGPAWQGLATNPLDIENLFSWAEATQAAAGRLARPDEPAAGWIEALVGLVRHDGSEARGVEAGRVAVGRLSGAIDGFEAARRDLARLAETPDDWLGSAPADDWLSTAAAVAGGWENHANQSQRWCRWREVAGSAANIGLAPLVSALMAGAIGSDRIADAFELGYARWWVEQIIEREDVLRTFVAEQHGDLVTRFAELDTRVADLARQVVLSQLSGGLPPRTAFGRDPEFGTLAREIEKRSRHMPLRQLFGQMPTALAKLAPCMMMSPLSVAQYLPADAHPYDIVIFDEASQIPVWDAIGAIARGKRVIVVGDPKQLPPTAFFDRTSDSRDDSSDLEDLESILDECLAANIPHKRLAWHYRSRHESLIAFSNERYYDGRLVTFPSPVTDDRAVRYVPVPGGVYERGAGRVNREEARALVRDVVRRLGDPEFRRLRRSLGIVTFNTEQQHHIETLLDQERRAHPELERFFGSEWHEAVFVKNLENVQGDERDIILFSVGYGPDSSGRVSQNFGPLNKDGGARRLNVAITRARLELVVFGTLHPDQIDLSRTKAVGVRDFKHFLEYAERGVRALAEAAAPLDREADSPFEDSVRKALERLEWVVHPQVGVAGFRVDLGIVDPDAAGRYLAGVECDGATYHRSATARDRDLLRERVLRSLGWRIRRVWSTDWWVDPGRAIATLHAGLKADLEAARQAASEKIAELEAAVATRQEAEMLAPAPLSVDAALEPEAAEPQPQEPAKAVEALPAHAQPAFAYADRVAAADDLPPAGPTRNDNDRRYRTADLGSAGFHPNRELFYETSYRPDLRRMVAHVITTEGPVFDDIVVERIARAHGFGRVTDKIRQATLDVVERRFQRSTEGERKVFWPVGADKRLLPPFRPGSPEDRDHVDIPLVELASLAWRFLEQGSEPEEVVSLMGRELGVGRLREAARGRFLQAAQLAKRRSLQQLPGTD